MLKGNWKKICTVEMYLVLQEKCEWFKPQNLMLAPFFIHCVSCKVSLFFLKVLGVWIVPSTLENLTRFVLPCCLVVKLNWWISIKNFWAWLHASLVVAGCLKLSIFIHLSISVFWGGDLSLSQLSYSKTQNTHCTGHQHLYTVSEMTVLTTAPRCCCLHLNHKFNVSHQFNFSLF